MLDVHSGPYFDAGMKQDLDVFPTLGASGARDIGMRQFVDQRGAWPAPEYGLGVHFLKCLAAGFNLAMRQNLEALGLFDRVPTRVRLTERNDDIDSSFR